uniref:Methyltransferase type 11 domain-containing protein n=2 Tax=Aegilops tauschii subsp. strangulata TaxID=200361 RepID=A0A453T5V6_AEGTS
MICDNLLPYFNLLLPQNVLFVLSTVQQILSVFFFWFCRNLALVRADILRLPFASCSIDAIHAGAAIHCWPSPSNAIAEISRVLKPGGVFVATTFLSTPTNSGLFSIDALKPLRQIVGPVNSSYNFFIEGELEDLCRSCGLVNYSSKVQRSFIMFSRQKP